MTQNNNEKIAKLIPRTKEELDEIKSGMSTEETQTVLNKTYLRNEKISQCKKIVRMFESEEFKSFWDMIHTEMKKILDVSPAHIKGNPFEKLDQLGTIQGGLEMLESQSVQMEIIKNTAKGEVVNTQEMEAKLKVINSNK